VRWAQVAPGGLLGYTLAMTLPSERGVTAVQSTAFQDKNPDGRHTAPRRDSSNAFTF
jgi:hypothetical protein